MRGESDPAWVRSGRHRGCGTTSESGGNVRGRGWGVARLSSALLHPQRELPPPAPPAGITRSKSKHELKLLEKIPENAEATVVLVGMWGELGGQGAGGRARLGGAQIGRASCRERVSSPV